MRSEFEKNRYWIGLFKTDVEFNGLLGEFGRYELNGSRKVNHSYLEDFNSKWEAYAKAWQHQQSKVDEITQLYAKELFNKKVVAKKASEKLAGLQLQNDELQKRVDELTVGCGLQRDHIKELETELKKAWTAVDQEAHKNHELVMLLKFIKEHFEMNDLDKAMPRVYEKLEQALKGEQP